MRPPKSTRTDTLVPSTALFRSHACPLAELLAPPQQVAFVAQMEQVARMLARNHGVAVVPDVDTLPAVDLQDEVVLLVEVERRDRVRRGDEDPASAVAHSRVDGDRKSTRLNSSH